MFDRLTKKDIEKMEQEIEHRKLVVRRQALEDVKEARAQGDLSENFEYKAAKKFKNEDDSSEEEVGMNDSVTVYFEDDDAEEVYKIVTTIRSDALKQMISIESPMGKALMKHKTGDRVYVKVNDKVGYYVVIKKIEKSDDESEGIKGF